MRRLLQFGTLFFVLVTFLAPLAECFDRWDAPGIGNDTEFAVFFLIFALPGAFGEQACFRSRFTRQPDLVSTYPTSHGRLEPAALWLYSSLLSVLLLFESDLPVVRPSGRA